MFKQPSDTLKQKSTNARRAATTLRSLGESPDLDHADQGVLLKAAQILEAHARKKSAEAKGAKATEEAFERATTKAAAEIKRAIDAWAVTSTLDQVALISLYDRDALPKHLAEPDYRDAKSMRWLLGYRGDDARRNLVSSAAYDVAKGRTTAAEQIARLRSRYDTALADAALRQVAARIGSILVPQAVAA